MAILSHDQHLRLSEAIRLNFNPLNLDLLLGAVKNRDLDAFVGDNMGRDARIYALVQVADQDGWVLDLIEKAHEERADVAEFGAILEELLGTLHVPGDDVIRDTLLVSGDQPFFDRGGLKEQLVLMRDANRRTLVINGAPGSGKTYSRKLLNHLKDVLGIEVIVFDCKRFAFSLSGEALTAVDLGKKIALEMALGDPPEHESESEARWSQFYASWLIGKLRNDSRQFWIVVDHLDKVLLTQGLKELLGLLAYCADENPDLRLILLGYDHSDEFESDDLNYEVAHDDIPLIDEDKLVAYFKAFYGQLDAKHGTQHGVEAAIKAAAVVLFHASQESSQQLKRMSTKAREQVQQALGAIP